LSWLSLGAGFDVQYVAVRLTQAIDFGSACVAKLGGATCAAAFGLTPGASDGQVDNSGHSFGYGFNLGVLAEPVAGTRLGIAYRSTIDQHVAEGRQTFVVPAGARAFLTAGGMPIALTGSAISTGLPLPGRLSFGLKQTLAPGLDLLLDATLTFWDVFGSTSITASNPARGASVVIQQGYRNAWRFAAGLEYKLSERWTIRTGVAYDQTPIPASAAQAALPDSDRVYLAGGVSARFDDRWSLDFGYSHVFYVNTVQIGRTAASGDTLEGNFTGGGNVLAAQLKMQY
jgi:long-chain fatty acid transport protein